jgi:enoyl-[acyl-carrier-protein] reductase (NADH)
MILKDKTILITGILTDKSIAYATAQVAIEMVPKLLQQVLEKVYVSQREQ